MIKFLCTRQDTAERLGVQGLNVLGYLRPMRDEPNRSMNCLQCRKTDDDTVCGTTLLLKTLHFTQQLAQDLVFLLLRSFKVCIYHARSNKAMPTVIVNG